jgi:hypothetical protein
MLKLGPSPESVSPGSVPKTESTSLKVAFPVLKSNNSEPVSEEAAPPAPAAPVRTPGSFADVPFEGVGVAVWGYARPMSSESVRMAAPALVFLKRLFFILVLRGYLSNSGVGSVSLSTRAEIESSLSKNHRSTRLRNLKIYVKNVN